MEYLRFLDFSQVQLSNSQAIVLVSLVGLANLLLWGRGVIAILRIWKGGR